MRVGLTMKTTAEKFTVEVSAAYTPWPNGISERNHYIMDVCVCVWEMVEKDLKMELDVALAWVVNAKNC